MLVKVATGGGGRRGGGPGVRTDNELLYFSTMNLYFGTVIAWLLNKWFSWNFPAFFVVSHDNTEMCVHLGKVLKLEKFVTEVS